MTGGGFFGKYGPLNPAPEFDIVDGDGGPCLSGHRDLTEAFERDLLGPLRGELRRRVAPLRIPFRRWSPQSQEWLEAASRLPLVKRLALEALETVEELDWALTHGPIAGTENDGWMTYVASRALLAGVLAQRLHLAPSEEWRRLSPEQRMTEGPRRAQKKRWSAHNTEVRRWRARASELWSENPGASVSSIARLIAKGSSASWETIRQRIRDCRPHGE